MAHWLKCRRISGLQAEISQGDLIIGNSPVKPDSWSGELKGIAIYHRELTATEVAQHYDDWKKKGDQIL